MSADILRFTGSGHAHVDGLIPWLANGTLSDETREMVELHVAMCSVCRNELALCIDVRDACLKGRPALLPEPNFGRLRERIGSVRQCVPDHSPSSGSTRRGWRRASTPMHALVAAQAVLLLAVVGAWAFWSASPPPATFRTLSTQAAPAAPADSARLVVVFHSAMRMDAAHQLLRASSARIVDGPSDAGAYIVDVPRSRVAAVRDGLRSARGVRLVEEVDSGLRQ